MRPLTISLLLALLTLISALPSPAPLTPRKNYCHNVPNTPAGTYVPPSIPPNSQPPSN